MLIRDIFENFNSSMKISSSGSSEISQTKLYIMHYKIWKLNVSLACVQQGHVIPIYSSFPLSMNAIKTTMEIT